MPCYRNTHFKVQSHYSSYVLFHAVRARAYLLKRGGTNPCAFAEQTKQSIISCRPIEFYLFPFIYLFCYFQFLAFNYSCMNAPLMVASQQKYTVCGKRETI